MGPENKVILPVAISDRYLDRNSKLGRDVLFIICSHGANNSNKTFNDLNKHQKMQPFKKYIVGGGYDYLINDPFYGPLIESVLITHLNMGGVLICSIGDYKEIIEARWKKHRVQVNTDKIIGLEIDGYVYESDVEKILNAINL